MQISISNQPKRCDQPDVRNSRRIVRPPIAVASQVARANEKGINDNRPIYTASVGLPEYVNPFPNEIHPSGGFFIARARAMTRLTSPKKLKTEIQRCARDVQTTVKGYRKRASRRMNSASQRIYMCRQPVAGYARGFCLRNYRQIR